MADFLSSRSTLHRSCKLTGSARPLRSEPRKHFGPRRDSTTPAWRRTARCRDTTDVDGAAPRDVTHTARTARRRQPSEDREPRRVAKRAKDRCRGPSVRTGGPELHSLALAQPCTRAWPRRVKPPFALLRPSPVSIQPLYDTSAATAPTRSRNWCSAVRRHPARSAAANTLRSSSRSCPSGALSPQAARARRSAAAAAAATRTARAPARGTSIA